MRGWAQWERLSSAVRVAGIGGYGCWRRVEGAERPAKVRREIFRWYGGRVGRGEQLVPGCGCDCYNPAHQRSESRPRGYTYLKHEPIPGVVAFRPLRFSHSRPAVERIALRREYSRRLYHEKLKHSPLAKLTARVRGTVRRQLLYRAKTPITRKGSLQARFGWTWSELRIHLEARFLPGMTWANHRLWHIDHIRPMASFSFTRIGDPEFIEAWQLSNLQPLWATDNLRKGAKWTVALP